jgi:hypothetical protein
MQEPRLAKNTPINTITTALRSRAFQLSACNTSATIRRAFGVLTALALVSEAGLHRAGLTHDFQLLKLPTAARKLLESRQSHRQQLLIF